MPILKLLRFIGEWIFDLRVGSTVTVSVLNNIVLCRAMSIWCQYIYTNLKVFRVWIFRFLHLLPPGLLFDYSAQHFTKPRSPPTSIHIHITYTHLCIKLLTALYPASISTARPNFFSFAVPPSFALCTTLITPPRTPGSRSISVNFPLRPFSILTPIASSHCGSLRSPAHFDITLTRLQTTLLTPPHRASDGSTPHNHYICTTLLPTRDFTAIAPRPSHLVRLPLQN